VLQQPFRDCVYGEFVIRHGQAAALQTRRQRLAFDQLHHQVRRLSPTPRQRSGSSVVRAARDPGARDPLLRAKGFWKISESLRLPQNLSMVDPGFYQ